MNEEERLKARRQYRLDKIKDDSNFYWVTYHKYRLEQFKVTPDNRQAFKMALNYIPLMDNLKTPDENFKTQEEQDAWIDTCWEPPHHFLTFAGPPGRGKTYLALGIGIARIEKCEEPTIYYQVPLLLNLLRSAYRPDSNVNPYDIIKDCWKIGCLILDDLGMQRSTDWAVEQLDSIIDHRYLNEQDTIFTTNLLPNALGSERISSRIKEGEIAILGGPDYREIIARQRKEQRDLKKLNDELKEIAVKKAKHDWKAKESS